MTEDQLALPFDVRVVATPAMDKGESRVDQCAWCGLLVCCSTAIKLGDCPGCGRGQWWRQDRGPEPGSHFSGPFHHRAAASVRSDVEPVPYPSTRGSEP